MGTPLSELPQVFCLYSILSQRGGGTPNSTCLRFEAFYLKTVVNFCHKVAQHHGGDLTRSPSCGKVDSSVAGVQAIWVFTVNTDSLSPSRVYKVGYESYWNWSSRPRDKLIRE